MCPGKILPVTTLLGQSRLKYKAKEDFRDVREAGEHPDRRKSGTLLTKIMGAIKGSPVDYC